MSTTKPASPDQAQPTSSSVRIACLAIGDELLDGRIADTNSQRLAEKLFDLGIRISSAAVVDDDEQRIAAEVTRLSMRHDVVITSGGLGPTTDDLTAESVARAAGVGTHLDADTLRSIAEKFASRGMEMPPNNEGQALVPDGSRVIENGAGISPAFVTRIGTADVWSLPGVPSEYFWFVKHHLLSSLQEAVGARKNEFIARRTVRCLGLTESAVGHALDGFEKEHRDVRVQYRTRFPENHVRLVVTDEDGATAESRVDRLASEVRALLGGAAYAVGDDELSTLVIRKLIARHETVSVAESCTGGLMMAALTDVPGASSAFMGGVVAYDNSVKTKACGVTQLMLDEHGAVSENVAFVLADHTRAQFQTTWALSVTGIAGPSGGTDEKPVGTVCFGLSGPTGTTTKKRLLLMPGRERVRSMSVAVALRWLLSEMEKQDSRAG